MKSIKDLTHRSIIAGPLCNQTKKQGLSDAWKIHRIGRITVSISKLAFITKVESPSKTFINTVMQYKPSTDNAATTYRQKNTSVSGLNVNVEFPHLGASPGGVVSCSFHGKALLEIKCPHKYILLPVTTSNACYRI